MSVWLVVWVVGMMFWLFGGGWATYNGPNANPMYFGAYCFIPWLCVLILGLFVFGALSPGAAPIAPVR